MAHAVLRRGRVEKRHLTTEAKCIDADGLADDAPRAYAKIVNAARRILRNAHDAEDVAQEVFLRAIRKQRTDGRRAPAAWLHRVAVNLCLNRLRDERRRRELMLGHALDESRDAPPDTRAILVQLLDAMPSEFERPVLRHYLEDESHREIAEALGVSRRTVGNRIAAFHAWMSARA